MGNVIKPLYHMRASDQMATFVSECMHTYLIHQILLQWVETEMYRGFPSFRKITRSLLEMSVTCLFMKGSMAAMPCTKRVGGAQCTWAHKAMWTLVPSAPFHITDVIRQRQFNSG